MATSQLPHEHLVYVANGRFTTAGSVTIPLDARKHYLLITYRSGYSLPYANANMYLLGVDGTRGYYTKLTANTDEMGIDISDNENLVLTATYQNYYWLFALN